MTTIWDAMRKNTVVRNGKRYKLYDFSGKEVIDRAARLFKNAGHKYFTKDEGKGWYSIWVVPWGSAKDPLDLTTVFKKRDALKKKK